MIDSARSPGIRGAGVDSAGAVPRAGRWWLGIALTAAAALLFEVLSRRLVFIPNPPAILLATVVFAAFHGGMRAGISAAAIAWLYFAHFFSIPGEPFRYTDDNFVRVAVWALATPAIAIMTGLLQQRALQLANAEKANAMLKARLAERASAIEAMGKLNERMRLVTDNAPTQIAHFDAAWRCRYCNAPYARWFGLEPEAAAGRHVRELVGDAMYTQIEPQLRAVSAGVRVRLQGSMTRGDGQVRTVEGNLTPHTGPDGRPLGFYVFFNDTTDRIQAEESARRKGAELERMIETMAEGVAMFDPEGRYTLLNAAAERIFGEPREAVLGRRVDEEPWKRMRSDGSPVVEEEAPVSRQRAGEGSVYGWQIDIVRRDGRRVSLEINSVALRKADGTYLGTISTFSDITERKRSEEAVQRSEQIKSATLAAALDAIITVDHEGNVVEFNPAAEQCFGFPRDEVLGRPMVELLVPPRLRASHREGFRRYVATREGSVLGRRLVMPALRADGSEIEIELAIIAIPAAEPPIFTAFARDVTEVRRAEAAARVAKERLDRALEGANVALFECDVKSGRVYLSEGWAGMIGAEAGETHTTVGELLQLLHPEERDQLIDLAIEAIKGQRPGYDAEHRVRRRDGQWMWVLSRCRAERGADGRCVRMAGTNVDITERKHAEQRMRYLATRDALTDLTNRALFGDGLEEAIELAARHSERIGLVSIGLDRFTTINDSLGHQAGDLVLKHIADRISAAAGPANTVARPGGDEFLVLLARNQSVHEAAGWAEKLLAEIARPVRVEERELVVTASAGVALYPDDGDSAGLLLRNAGIALHHAKERGRNNVQFFAEHLNVAARARLEIEAAMRRGLDRDEFVVHYQPQVDIATGALVGFEALVRWQDPVRGLVPPGDFLPVAESTGLIVMLGERVLAKACRQAARWQKLSGSPLRVGVNVTARQFREKGFVKSVRAALAASGLDARLLELEIIENAIMEPGSESVATLDTLGELGVRLAIDDFGTGYSSLSYLKRLPIDKVKIDQSFVADLPGDPDAGAIVGAIVALAHNLGLEVTAEGVETQAQLAYLREHGCDHAQGYFFGRPVPAERVCVGEGGKVVALGT